MKYKNLFVLIGLGVALLSVGCTDRGANPQISSGRPAWTVDPIFDHVFLPRTTDSAQISPSQLLMQVQNPTGLLLMSAYIPWADSVPYSEKYQGKELPVLVLFAPQDGDKMFYLNHGLNDIAHELITQGVIRPMIIITVGNDSWLGGMFFGNSIPAGHMDDVMDTAFVNFLDSRFPPGGFADVDTSRIGLGGFGMGGYGAYRALLKHPTLYKSISVTDGPYDFDGASAGGNGGLIPMIDVVFQEQNLRRDSGWSYIANNFDTSKAWPVSRLFLGGSLAFSPHDIDISVIIQNSTNNFKRIDIRSRTGYPDSATLVSQLLQGTNTGVISANAPIQYSFHLPFNELGQVHLDTWGRWMANNLDTLLGDGSTVNDVPMWIGTTPEAEYTYYDMTQSWISTLRDRNINPTVFAYSGTTGHDAGYNSYAYYMLREMLIFHSNALGD